MKGGGYFFLPSKDALLFFTNNGYDKGGSRRVTGVSQATDPLSEPEILGAEANGVFMADEDTDRPNVMENREPLFGRAKSNANKPARSNTSELRGDKFGRKKGGAPSFKRPKKK